MRKKLLAGAMALAAVGLSATVIIVGTAHTQAAAAKPATVDPVGFTTGYRTLTLRSMPTGTVSFVEDHGRLDATLNAYGFTPGSIHGVEIDGPTGAAPEVRLDRVTADATGRIHATSAGIDAIKRLTPGSTFVIRLGNNTSDFNRNLVAGEIIARSTVLPRHPAGQTFALHSVSVDPNGVNLGRLHGTVALRFNAKAKSLAITVNAKGFAPNSAHAAHIHVGSCRSQGPVQYMIPDLQADAHGNVVNQTRVVQNVTAMPTGKLYLNVHQGDMNSILVNGAPALSFRPLLCANL